MPFYLTNGGQYVEIKPQRDGLPEGVPAGHVAHLVHLPGRGWVVMYAPPETPFEDVLKAAQGVMA